MVTSGNGKPSALVRAYICLYARHGNWKPDWEHLEK